MGRRLGLLGNCVWPRDLLSRQLRLALTDFEPPCPSLMLAV